MNRGGGLYSWFFQRITGILLAIGILLHLLVNHFGESPVSFDSVAFRVRHLGWFIFDILLLGLCFYHGFNGLVSVIIDFNPGIKIKKGVVAVMFSLGVIIFIYGVLSLTAFRP